MGNPYAGTGLHDGFQRSHQSTSRMHDADASVLITLMNVGLAICKDDHFLDVEISAKSLFESLRCPSPALPVCLLLHNDPVDQLTHIVENRLEFRPLEGISTKKSSKLITPPSARQSNRNNAANSYTNRQ